MPAPCAPDETEAERQVWHRISRYRPRFTRQLVVGRYIIDLACRSAKLAVEFDGAQHLDRQAYDDRRTVFLIENGWTVLRFWNGDVAENPDGVVETILAQDRRVPRRHPPPTPPFQGGEEEKADLPLSTSTRSIRSLRGHAECGFRSSSLAGIHAFAISTQALPVARHSGVSTYCWKATSLPSLSVQGCSACGFIALPVAR